MSTSPYFSISHIAPGDCIIRDAKSGESPERGDIMIKGTGGDDGKAVLAAADDQGDLLGVVNRVYLANDGTTVEKVEIYKGDAPVCMPIAAAPHDAPGVDDPVYIASQTEVAADDDQIDPSTTPFGWCTRVDSGGAWALVRMRTIFHQQPADAS